MTTTPTIWKAKFTPNFQSGAGEQTLPQSIGLANGNILTVWEDDTGGSSPGRDIMGQMFDPLGNNIGPVFQVNVAIVNQDETAPQIAALPDGGYVVAYGSHDSSLGDYIVVQRFDSSGVMVSNGQHFITDDNDGITNGYDGQGFWEVTVDNNGNYIVAFERDHDVKAIVYNYISNNPLPERSVAQNSSDIDHLGNIATFNDGNVITVSNEYDDDFQGVEYMIWQSATGNVVVPPVAVGGAGAGLGTVDATSRSVAVLTGGQFVIVYSRLMEDLSKDMAMRIGASDAPGAALSPEIVISGDNSAAKVVALNDGGFLVVWGSANLSDGVLRGTRYTADGTVVGSAGFQFATGVGLAFGYLGDLSLTGDGRVLVTWHGADGEIAEVILDPRENTIYGTDNGEVLTAQIGASRVLAFGGDDTIYGSAGDDELIDGGTGVDTLRGRGGNDFYLLLDVNKTDPNLNLWFYDSVIEAANQGNDTIQIAYVANAKTTYVLPANVENGVVAGSAAFNLTGNGLDNQLTGNEAANTLTGELGNDTLNGGLGDDALFGNQDNDTLFGNQNNDTLYGGQGNDTLYGGQNDDTLVGGAGDDNLAGGAGIDTASYVNATASVTVSLALQDAAQNTGADGLDTLSQIENLTGSAFADSLTGDDNLNVLTGAFGNDTLSGGINNDTLYGNQDNDTLYGNQNNDTLYGGQGNDTLYGGQNADTLVGGAGDDSLVGGLDNDTFVFQAGFGHDTVTDFDTHGGGEHDVIQFSTSVFADFAAVQSHMSLSGANDVLITDNSGDTILIAGGQSHAFVANDFLFVA